MISEINVFCRLECHPGDREYAPRRESKGEFEKQHERKKGNITWKEDRMKGAIEEYKEEERAGKRPQEKDHNSFSCKGMGRPKIYPPEED